MNRNELLSSLIERETGRIFAGAPIWDEIERAVGAYPCEDAETVWLTGQDDVLMKWDYYVEISRGKDEDTDQYYTDIHLIELKIEDKQTHDVWNIEIK